MPTTLVKNAALLITMSDARDTFEGGAVYIRDNVVDWVGAGADLPAGFQSADHVIDAAGMVVLPGLVNTHHHFYQTLTRVIAPNRVLFDWLTTLYPIWARMDGEAVYISALTAMSELILSGCTTSSDHLYLFPNGSLLDDEIRAAQEIGMRFHAARGSMSLGESKGGLPPDSVVQSDEEILQDSRRVVETFHDANPYAMLRVVIAPCSPFSVTPDLMRESAALARAYGVTLHTHLAETLDEEAFCLEQFGHRPAAYAERLDWVGDDVWWAHSVHVSDEEVDLMARTATGAAHCPSSNMRLASGIAPIRAMVDRGVPVGLGVDGSASNDGSHMFAEARVAMLLQRVTGNPAGLSGEEALWLATRGGASVLRRDDIGQLASGKAADLIAVNLHQLPYAGATHDPLNALTFCAPPRVDLSIINGKIVVQDGRLLTLDLGPHIERHNRISRKLIRDE